MIYLELFLTFFKIGLFTFGGGASMIPIIQQEVVSNGWLTEEQLLQYIAISESTPGPIAINMATFIGSTQVGIIGSLCETLGVVLPSFIIILLIAMVFKKFAEYKGLQTILKTIRPIIVGMIIAAGAYLVITAIGIHSYYSMDIDLRSVIITSILAVIMIGFKLIFKKHIPIIPFILVSACVGIVAYLI